MKGRILWCLMFAACFAALAFNSPTRAFALSNLLVQLLIFLLSANLPAWRNNRLSYVDFAWPAGLTAIGLQTFWFAEARMLPVLVVAGIYLLVGLRMAVWAVHMYKPGVLTRDLPRYEYQRQRWARALTAPQPCLGGPRRRLPRAACPTPWAPGWSQPWSSRTRCNGRQGNERVGEQ